MVQASRHTRSGTEKGTTIERPIAEHGAEGGRALNRLLFGLWDGGDDARRRVVTSFDIVATSAAGVSDGWIPRLASLRASRNIDRARVLLLGRVHFALVLPLVLAIDPIISVPIVTGAFLMIWGGRSRIPENE